MKTIRQITDADLPEARLRADGIADAERIIAGGRPQTWRNEAREKHRDQHLVAHLEKLAEDRPDLSDHDIGRGRFECLQALAQREDQHKAILDRFCPPDRREKLVDTLGRW